MISQFGAVEPTFHSHTADDSVAKSGSTVKMVIGTISLIVGLVLLVMGGIFVYKRYQMKKNLNIRIHFENPRAAFDAARVKVSQLNEIFINRQNNVTELVS